MVPDKLDPYRAKRRAGATPEPVPPKPADPGGSGNRRRAPAKKTGAKKTAAKTTGAKKTSTRAGGKRPGRDGQSDGIFVVQEHHARALHWDFRLERDGVLVSWAVPKGLPLDPKTNHLAVHTEDHPLEYSAFEGEIPSGQYGGGTVRVWDRGVYELEKWSEREVMVVLHGERVKGRYVLFSTAATSKRPSGGSGKDNWMIHRMDPAPAAWEPLPERVRPMLCQAGELPTSDAGWAYEFKWDGVRALCWVDGGRIRIVSRNERDVTVSYPELRSLGATLGARPAILDGEIVALDEVGRPSFGVLQQRIHVNDAARARRLAETVPISFMVFDVLHLDGRSTVDLSYDERRRVLEDLQLEGASWTTPPAFLEALGADIMAAARDQGLEGVVAKRRTSKYVPDARSDSWIKVKHFVTQDVVIGGWSAGQGNRAGTIGALLVGIPGPDGLVYAGKVGTGFSDSVLDDLGKRLARLARVTPPFVGDLPRAQVTGARWVRPSLVGEVRFTEWTADGRLRHPSWRGLRPDRSPAEVTRGG